MSRFKSMKFRVKDEAHSRAIQAKLFEMGYSLVNNADKQLYDHAAFLYTDAEGEIQWDFAEDFEDYEIYDNIEMILTEGGRIVISTEEALCKIDALQFQIDELRSELKNV